MTLRLLSEVRLQTFSAVVVHEYYFLEQVRRCSVDDAAYGSFYDRQSLIHVDQNHTNGWEILWINLSSTSE